jgi:hypothetical protein
MRASGRESNLPSVGESSVEAEESREERELAPLEYALAFAVALALSIVVQTCARLAHNVPRVYTVELLLVIAAKFGVAEGGVTATAAGLLAWRARRDALAWRIAGALVAGVVACFLSDLLLDTTIFRSGAIGGMLNPESAWAELKGHLNLLATVAELGAGAALFFAIHARGRWFAGGGYRLARFLTGPFVGQILFPASPTARTGAGLAYCGAELAGVLVFAVALPLSELVVASIFRRSGIATRTEPSED